MDPPIWKRTLPFLPVVAVCLASTYFGDIHSRTSLDFNHWGLIYSSAVDLLDGRMPFRETYEIYGLLSAGLNAVGLVMLGETIVSVGRITAFFYATNLLLAYLIARRFLDPWTAVFVPVLTFLVHPYIAFPWPNYASYTFYLLGVYFLLGPGRHALLLGGFLFGLSLLARQTIGVSTLPVAAVFVGLKWWQQRNARTARQESASRFVLGAILPLAAFFVFLLSFDLLGEWARQSFGINATLLSYLEDRNEYHSSFDFIGPFISNVYLGERTSMRSVTLVLIAWLSTGYILGHSIRAIRRGRPTDRDIAYILVALSSLLAFNQGLHLFKLFRFASGISLGFILIATATQSLCGLVFAHKRRAAIVVLVVAATALSTNVLDNPEIAGRSRIPSQFLRLELEPYQGPVKPLRGSRWSKKHKRLERLQASLERSARCGLRTFVNTADDPLAPYLVEGLEKAQREAGRRPRRLSDEVFPEEVARRKDLLKQGAAILLAGPLTPIPKNYRVVGSVEGGKVAVPEGCLDLPDPG